MKRFIVLVCFITAVSASVFSEDIKEILFEQMEYCAEDVHASGDDVKAVKGYSVPETHEGKCILYCLQELYNMQNEDGSMNLEGCISALIILEDIDMELYKTMIEVYKVCAKIVADEDHCITAARFLDCIIKEGEKHGVPRSTFAD